MNIQSRLSLLAGFLALGLSAVSAINATSADPAPNRKPQLPDAAFDELIQEANKNIQEELGATNAWELRLRANALMIALAAQHRMAHQQGDARQLATLRDAVVRLARTIDRDGTSPRDFGELKRQAGILNEYPKLKADPNAVMEIIRLKGIFDQEDIDFHFARKRKQAGIERELLLLLRAKEPITADQIARKHEMLGYKIALLAELLRDFDDHIPPQKVDQRKEWVSHATEVQDAGWELAEVFRAKNANGVKAVVQRLNETCMKCHEKFRW